MIVSLSAVLLFGALVVILWRYAGLRPSHALVCTLFGFYLASSSLAPSIRGGTRGVVRFLSGIDL